MNKYIDKVRYVTFKISLYNKKTNSSIMISTIEKIDCKQIMK